MAEPVPGPQVFLPWAPYAPLDQRAASASEQRAQDERNVRVEVDSLMVGDAPAGEAMTAPLRAKTGQGLHPRLSAVGLPYRPAPVIPSEDRPLSLNEESLVSLAVALDILATRLADLEDDSAVLDALCQSLIELGALGGVDEDAVERLLVYAEGPAGQNRAALSHALTSSLAPAGEASLGEPASPSTPRTVVDALRQIEDATRLIVREASLLLEAHGPVSYWQA